MVLKCSRCGKPVSTEVQEETVVRAWIECPECIEKGETMDDKTRYKLTKNVAGMVASLYRSTIDAGGYPGFDLEHMTVMELISILAPNGIQFIFVKPNKKEETCQ